MNPFWQLDAASRATAVVEVATGRTLTYAELGSFADTFAQRLPPPRRRAVVFVFCRNDLTSLAAYLGCLRAGHVAALLPAGAPVANLLETYAPDRLIAPAGAGPFPGYTALDEIIWQRATASGDIPVHDALALLLSTSGSTGSPKLVRLSSANLQANAAAIAGYLALTPAERAPTTLPLSYSYGLSVVNSHLAAGATLLLGDFPVVQQPTWQALAQHGATSFAGVPLLYHLLRRLRLDPRAHPALRTFTQAGGRLDPETKRWFLDQAEPAGVRFFSMYGQTEATARISFVPPNRLREKIDAIGWPIAGGELSVDRANGELIYRGPNVMLGYAESRADLADGDVQRGTLRTGDLGHADADGFFHIAGRLKRFLKLAGLRVSLDELERHLESKLGCVVACGGGDEALVVHAEAAVPAARVQSLLQQDFGLAPSLVTVRADALLTRLPSGKIDYAALVHG